MANRDPRKMSAFESGMRGKSKPKISGNGRGDAGTQGPDGGAGGENKQAGGATIGTPKGVGLDAYSSGMRGTEKPKQKSPDAATLATGNEAGAGSNKQGPGTSVGNPKGDNTAQSGQRATNDASMRSNGTDAYDMGIDGNNTERAAAGMEPSAEEDDTHINIRIPKSSVKRKQSGLHGN